MRDRMIARGEEWEGSDWRLRRSGAMEEKLVGEDGSDDIFLNFGYVSTGSGVE